MNCPLCQTLLITKAITMCECCGGEDTDPKRNEHFRCEMLGRQLILCDFCTADIESLEAEFLGLPEENAYNYDLIIGEKVKNKPLQEQEFCQQCNLQLKFLEFVKNVRKDNIS